MKNLKKIGALLLALVLVLSLSAAAFADSDLAGDGVDGSKAATESSTKVTLYKELTVFNPSAATVNAPTISYTYEIAGAAGGSTITDADSISAVTYDGVGAPTITPTVTWAPSESVNASAAGAKNTKPIEVDFSGVAFPRAGVYRYKITETITDAAYTAAGVVNGEISNERWLDVYVKDTNIIYGYVLMDASPEAVTSTTAKTEGFVATTGEGAKTADQYHTFNLTISKAVVDDAYIKSTHHQFPFAVTFNNATVTGAVKPIVSTNGTATLTQADAAAIADFGATAPTIADSGSVTYTGIPMGTAVSIVEQNNVAGTTYAVTTAGADTNITTAELVASGSSTTGTIAVAAQTAGTEADKTVAVTNTLALISPTGVVLRVAPYILMLAGGIVLLALSRKRKSREEA